MVVEVDEMGIFILLEASTGQGNIVPYWKKTSNCKYFPISANRESQNI